MVNRNNNSISYQGRCLAVILIMLKLFVTVGKSKLLRKGERVAYTFSFILCTLFNNVKNINVFLVVWVLSCGMWDLHCSAQGPKAGRTLVP